MGSEMCIRDRLGLDGNISTEMFDEISSITLKQGHKLGQVSPLFEKVEESVIEEQKSKLEDIG